MGTHLSGSEPTLEPTARRVEPSPSPILSLSLCSSCEARNELHKEKGLHIDPSGDLSSRVPRGDEKYRELEATDDPTCVPSVSFS